MSATQTRIQPPPHVISQFLHSTWTEYVLRSGVELKVFAELEAAPLTASELATRLDAKEEGLTRLLNALCAMQLLEKNADNYQLTDIARLYLTPDSPLYMGEYIMGRDRLLMVWEGLTDSIKSGKPHAAINQPEAAQEFFPWLAKAIFPLSFTTAQALAESVQPEKVPGEVRILDVASGSAAWSIPFAQRSAGIKVDALDFPATLDVTREFAREYQVEGQYQYLEGSWQEVSLAKNHYDFAILGHICHSEGAGETQKLFNKVFQSLKPGGRILIAEFLLDDNHIGPLFPVLFGINMFLVTEKGCVFSVDELKTMLEAAGFVQTQRVSLPYYNDQSPVVVAQKS